jgi:alanine racemase
LADPPNPALQPPNFAHIPRAMDTSLHSGLVEINLAALKSNWLALKAVAHGAEVAAPIKGEAYGLGLAPCAKALWSAGCRSFYVARPTEGETLRAVLPDASITVLDGLYLNQSAYYLKHRLIPAITSPAQAGEWANGGQGAPCTLHVDTGINRLGLSIAEYAGILKNHPKLNIAFVMSHLACSDEPAHPMNEVQRKRFDEIRTLAPHIKASFANSSGIYLGKSYTHDQVRPGVALYGGNPLPGHANPMQVVATLKARVMQIRELAPGDTLGYSATWTPSRPTRVALLGAGYRDGIPRKLSSIRHDGPGHVFLNGKRCPIVGRVSMDMMAVNVSNVTAETSDWAEIFGKNISVDEAAGWAQTISYELLTHLGNRYARNYVD